MARSRKPGKSIEDYRGKRDFARTPEPGPDERAPRPRDEGHAEDDGLRPGGAVFVVHRHEARRLHYDLRLQMEGVLRSWAVPKGFSYAPEDKHLAVRTEDHPLSYERFEGLIPPGEYGAGSLRIWDKGTYTLARGTDPAAEVASGELKLVLRGRRLRGEWHLVKTRGGPDHWLLFKSRDRYAGKPRDSALGVDLASAPARPMPARGKPMEAGRSGPPFRDPGWLFEAVLAGERRFLEKRGDEVRLRGLRRTPEALAEAARGMRAENALLDGWLVAPDAAGLPSPELLAERLAGRDDGPLAYYAFDLLYFDDFDLRPLACVERKAALRAVLPEAGALLFVEHVLERGDVLLRAALGAGLAGGVAKRAASSYRSGPSEDWVALEAPPGRPGAAGEAREPAARDLPEPPPARVKLTNLEKVYWPREGYTKGDLVGWYESVAELLVPYLRDRPIHMNRFPDGIDGKSFYQRQAKEDTPDWVRTVPIESDTHGGAIPQIVCDDRDTLLWLANSGSIDLHPWLSRWPTLDSPDWAILDLDPKGAPFRDVVRIAREIGKILFGVGLRPLLKTSGKTGLHVYVPLAEGYGYEHARMFCEGVARLVVRNLPAIATVERTIDSRAGKVYVDYGQNRRGQTVVPPYSVRPVPGATVSAPLSWDELDGELTPARFTIRTMGERLARLGELFRPALTDRQDLLPAIEALERYVGS